MESDVQRTTWMERAAEKGDTLRRPMEQGLSPDFPCSFPGSFGVQGYGLTRYNHIYLLSISHWFGDLLPHFHKKSGVEIFEMENMSCW